MSPSPSRADPKYLWRTLGVVIGAVLLARWVWVFMAPGEAALPATTAWKRTSDAARLFGDANSASNPAGMGSIRLTGVFSHPTAGFAILLVDGKQIGVGLGGNVTPGTRLVETQPEFVTLESSGVRTRVDLPAAQITTGISTATTKDSLKTGGLSPEQRAIMQQELKQLGVTN